MQVSYFSSTHWDREWYQTFQGFRKRLVDMADGMVRHLEAHPEFEVFHFDGQTIVLEDVVEIRPDLAPRLKKLIADERLIVGPWYDMPDEFLVSGEALVQNLIMGHRIAKEYGGNAWKFGYLCDTFGHIAQMPQILSGFGIRHALVGRGTNDHTTDRFYNWTSPDGTAVIAYKLPDVHGYGDFMQLIGFGNTPVEESVFKAKAKEYFDAKFAASKHPFLVLMDGIDHAPLHEHTATYLTWLRELYPDMKLSHGGMIELGDAVAEAGGLTAKQGELIEPAKQKGGYVHLITNTLSSYYPLKQQNDACEAMLERIAAPCMAMAHQRGGGVCRSYYELAWKYLIRNHPHDSICGCSIDRVHEDMRYRFAQTSDLANIIVEDFIHHDLSASHGKPMNDESHFRAKQDEMDHRLTLRVFNPLPHEQQGVFTFTVDFPTNYPNRFSEPFGYQQKNSFTIRDTAGNLLPYRITGMRRNQIVRVYNQFTKRVDRYEITLAAKIFPSTVTPFIIEPSVEPQRNMTTLLTGTHSAENEFLSLSVKTDGTVTVRDKRSGDEYTRLNTFASDGEIGDGWYHASEVGNRTVYSGANAAVEVIKNSPVRAAFRITQTMRLPAEMRYEGTIHSEFAGIRPSAETADMTIVTEVSLDAGSALLGMRVTVDHNVKDHRLRMMIPTGIQGPWFAYQTFCFIERPAGRMFGDTSTWKEMEPVEKNINNIAGKRGKNGGIVFFAKAGIHEAGTFDDADGTLAVTMLRAFRRTVMQNGESGGQLPGKLSYDCGLYFTAKDETYADIFRRYLSFATPLYSHTVSLHAPVCDDSFLTLSGKHIAYSTMKQPDDETPHTVVVRVMNLSDERSEAVLTFASDVREAYAVNLLEERIDASISVKGTTVKMPLSGWKVASVKVTFAEGK
ncbi:MAG: hypothetical protein HZC28_13760 [Spirochaetes bacterium]|nr:hypothetical protein [Spirochaetota bacterium]